VVSVAKCMRYLLSDKCSFDIPLSPFPGLCALFLASGSRSQPTWLTCLKSEGSPMSALVSFCFLSFLFFLDEKLGRIHEEVGARVRAWASGSWSQPTWLTCLKSEGSPMSALVSFCFLSFLFFLDEKLGRIYEEVVKKYDLLTLSFIKHKTPQCRLFHWE